VDSLVFPVLLLTLPTRRHLHRRIAAAVPAVAVVVIRVPVLVPVLAAHARVLAADAEHPSS